MLQLHVQICSTSCLVVKNAILKLFENNLVWTAHLQKLIFIKKTDVNFT